MPGHGTEPKTNAHVELRPHSGGRPVTSQQDFESGLHWGLLGVAMTLGVHSRVRGQAADLCQCPVPRLNGVLLTEVCKAYGFISNLVWKHCVQTFPDRHFWGRGKLITPLNCPNKGTQ